jgi:hypothetical protein
MATTSHVTGLVSQIILKAEAGSRSSIPSRMSKQRRRGHVQWRLHIPIATVSDRKLHGSGSSALFILYSRRSMTLMVNEDRIAWWRSAVAVRGAGYGTFRAAAA